MARIGVLTGGGDCPGLNAVIRAVVRRGLVDGGHSFVGFRHGWAGVLANDATELTRRRRAVRTIPPNAWSAQRTLALTAQPSNIVQDWPAREAVRAVR